jgi:prepilin-type N-terminal cleavage/methylation domain-containing protein
MRRRSKGFTLIEVLVALAVIAFGYFMYVQQGSTSVFQGKVSIAQQQAWQIQTAFEQWAMSQPSLAAARTSFNPTNTSTATAPASQVAFFSANLAPLLESTIAQDIINNSTATQLGSTDMNAIGASATLYWNSNYTANQPEVNLVVP